MSPNALAQKVKSAAATAVPLHAAAHTLPARQIAAILADPPSQDALYQSFNRVRQTYILQQVMQHFQVRDDDPAPLFGRTLLDVGCGTSTIAQFLVLSGAEITAIDPDRKVLAQAARNADIFGAPITFLPVRAEDMLATGERFDVVLALDLMESVENPEKTLFTLRQLIAPGGLLIVSAINRTPKAWIMHILLSSLVYGRTRRGLRTFSRFYRPAALRAMVKKAGFTFVHQQYLRLSSSRRRWKVTAQPDTRYLQAYTVSA